MAQWSGAPAQDNSELYKRLLAAYSIPADDRDTWLTDMADLFDRDPYAVVEAAVDRYLRDVQPEPREFVRAPAPHTFGDWVALAREEAQQAARRALPAPAPPPPGLLTPEEITHVEWLRSWYAGVLARRQEGAYLDDWSPHPTREGVWIRTAPEDMAWIRRVRESEDRLGHIPNLPPEQLKAALARNVSTGRGAPEGD